jgi:hypothetical protein
MVILFRMDANFVSYNSCPAEMYFKNVEIGYNSTFRQHNVLLCFIKSELLEYTSCIISCKYNLAFSSASSTCFYPIRSADTSV